MIVCLRHVVYKCIIPSLIIVNCSLLIISPVLAQPNDLVINADSVVYDKETKQVDARGSVEVIYKDVSIHGHHIVYDKGNEEVFADQGFILDYNGLTIEGQNLEYEVKTRTGEATNVDFVYQGVHLKGKKINFSQEDFYLSNASFTTCNLDHPHYHITAKDITLYPKYGWLVAYWGFFWFDRFPLVPVPTYIYDMRDDERKRKNLPPFPEVSSNDEDGWYINERLAWHVRRELSGSYSINYASKKGLGLGVEANYIVDDDNEGNVRVYGNTVEGLWGGLTHRYYFGKKLGDKERDPFALFALPKYRQYELETTLFFRERINYERVSYYPKVVVKERRGEAKVFGQDVNYDAEVMGAAVSEKNNIYGLLQGGGAIVLYKDLPEIRLGTLTPFIGLDGRVYSNGSRWLQSTGGLNVRKRLSENLSLKLGYNHYFLNRGLSPLNFERYRFSSADRLTTELLYLVDGTGVGIYTSYFVDTWWPEDIDYSLYLRMHCYNLIVKYRSLRREFSLGFSLAAGE
ncbi:hypothetical protein A2291_01670 [candidate division WOR-1 bacterium RIFOXYB2_FULL_42_35]|uniref:Organic solvent tolerance-like N-terminal domain-containing protein n=1 Tax=candidate division WOR-1 bacterium RIFOXYC2_FULL_41_25 TaxID=1802586 RepID=A0A1F4TQR0_UNCSA|nr:MAG: hypothetical protein A2247_03470 [candidate division WOR-1 bacterium RIFOXYA2_FULL_41_14]OGC25454.1 MAG: hypothetical protein A2291_01670 [candidate division WOR-1 bacterium RIFOXYB2_FULL_42_35]OGC34860.1 MAG: hypothetical protein A2462_05605 [candidate division WOR-1 bacterium RIFOXYC2_FULL_41_25]